ncbi:SRPBCC family protein [Mycobacterium sp.]|uniref:SRPBCC family protein n=1 Tax=Mycobacterium sp. TaxID=1785 RepID=UPI0025F6AAE6|nr:SRPBCC family protein [Mycobacterium sp.]MBW0015417.1 SRPBCC domain-containing protein [Mycobacterium sp.]
MNDAPVVRVRSVMPAPPAVVFEQWLDPESLMEWMCPRPVRCVAVSVDARVGGELRFDMDDSGVPIQMTGHFLEIDRPHRLRFTWSNSNWPDPTVASIVAVTFDPVGDEQTLMVIEHSLLPPDIIDEFRTGWPPTCDQLAALLSG